MKTNNTIFPALINAIIDEVNLEMKTVLTSLNEAAERREIDEQYISDFERLCAGYLTDAQRRKLAKIKVNDQLIFAQNEIKKHFEKSLKKKLLMIESAESAPDFAGGTVSIEWKPSRTWGYNPTAIAKVTGEYVQYIGKASGSGYDKESAAIAHALNQSASLRKAMYTHAERLLNDPTFFPERYGENKKIKHLLGYGSGYGALPYFEGGTGADCYRDFVPGFLFKKIGSGKSFDFYTFQKI